MLYTVHSCYRFNAGKELDFFILLNNRMDLQHEMACQVIMDQKQEVG